MIAVSPAPTLSATFRYIAIVILMAMAAAQAETLSGRVVAVADGDTLTVLDVSNAQYRIRLAGIDAPEKRQPYGDVSKRALSDRVFGKSVKVEWKKRDRYDRVIGKIEIDSVDVGLAQVEAGLAWHYKKYQGEQPTEDRIRYATAESTARTARRGLWKDDNPTPPWDWRRKK